jgi:hypothetical protein
MTDDLALNRRLRELSPAQLRRVIWALAYGMPEPVYRAIDAVAGPGSVPKVEGQLELGG